MEISPVCMDMLNNFCIFTIKDTILRIFKAIFPILKQKFLHKRYYICKENVSTFPVQYL